METFWDGQVEMRKVLQVWINRGLRKILGAVRTNNSGCDVGRNGNEKSGMGVGKEREKRIGNWRKR
ncbi:hypothetical protein C7212DRAFT_334809 [Tuber magnatum]|uniref:Uncharacterized protein n=1 Tax=Tuber magnatum TaxID=42249 RepID=A0A317SFQ7_9PEZI|nr:hypothetical protein C7212DRAFT_334809 [Tuber magnatum]